jgi:Na+:H+ antiporter
MARLCRFNHMESLRVGVGMMSRGEVALVVASAGATAGVVEGSLFSATVLMALVTTLLTPLLLKLTYRQEPVEAAAERRSVLSPEFSPAAD